MIEKKKKEWMNNYAELLIGFGVNIQPEQKLVFVLPHSAREFGLQVVEKAYAAGSGRVFVHYIEHDIYRIIQQRALPEVLEQGDSIIEQSLGSLIDNGAAVLFLAGAHPEAMSADTSEQRKTAFYKSFMKAQNEIHSRRRTVGTNSCLAFYPTLEYSSYMFDALAPSDAQARLMEMLTPILKLDINNPVTAWKAHRANLNMRADLLNRYAFESLHFHGGNNDLKLGLVKNHIWHSAFRTAKNGIDCACNFPTEELFTAPDWRTAEGRISSTRKTFIYGYMLDEVSLNFHKGRIIKTETDGDQEIIQKMLNQDEQSRYLGEVALVPENCPIASQPMSFKNLLFDENAGSHIAFGSSYPDTMKDGASMNKTELLNSGMNVSSQHIDLIVGSGELSVTGITMDGKEVEIMTKGLWAGEFNW